MAVIEIAAATTAEADPADVWAVLDDFAGWPNWMPSMEHMKVETPAERTPGLGYRFRLRSGIVHTDMEVVEYSTAVRETTFRISFPPIHGRNRCRVIPLDDGRLRIERLDSLEMPEALVDFLMATQRGRFERLAQEFVLALKRAVEQRRNAQTQP